MDDAGYLTIGVTLVSLGAAVICPNVPVGFASVVIGTGSVGVGMMTIHRSDVYYSSIPAIVCGGLLFFGGLFDIFKYSNYGHTSDGGSPIDDDPDITEI